jgi:hypothetical protein
MKLRLPAVAAALLVGALLVAAGAPSLSAQKKDRVNGRLLHGKVLDPQDSPVYEAAVYLTNTRTRAIKTYIVNQDGTYRFPGLSYSTDYEVYAQYKGHKSDTKSLSQFDDRSDIYLDLKLDTR